METIFITGSSGSLGKRISKVLLDRGNNVIGFDISSPPEGLRRYNSFRYIKGDITDINKLYDSIKDVDVGIHCAALLPDKNYLGSDAYIKVNSTGAVNFMKGCYERGIPKAIVISNTGVLEPNNNGVTYDNAKYRRKGSPYIRSKILAEKEVDKLNLKEKINYVILRSSAIYGPGMHYMWNNIFNMARKNRLFVISPGSSVYSIIHIDDLIDAILMTISKLDNRISGEKITITSDEKMPIYEILFYITDYFSSRPPVKVPYILALGGSVVSQWISRIIRNGFLSSITPENISGYRNGMNFDNTKALRLLGFKSRRNYKEEIEMVLKESG